MLNGFKGCKKKKQNSCWFDAELQSAVIPLTQRCMSECRGETTQLQTFEPQWKSNITSKGIYYFNTDITFEKSNELSVI